MEFPGACAESCPWVKWEITEVLTCLHNVWGEIQRPAEINRSFKSIILQQPDLKLSQPWKLNSGIFYHPITREKSSILISLLCFFFFQIQTNCKTAVLIETQYESQSWWHYYFDMGCAICRVQTFNTCHLETAADHFPEAHTVFTSQATISTGFHYASWKLEKDHFEAGVGEKVRSGSEEEWNRMEVKPGYI